VDTFLAEGGRYSTTSGSGGPTLQETLLDVAEKMDENALVLPGLVRLPETDLEDEEDNCLFLLK